MRCSCEIRPGEMGESSVKCCEAMERCAASVRHKSVTGKTRPTTTTINNGSTASASIDGALRPCTSPPYELDHMYANNCSGGEGCDANFARPSAKLLIAVKHNEQQKTSLSNNSPSSSSSSTTTTTADAQRQLLCMRELVFLHLDLIQQQQDQLDARDRQIAVLRQESDGFREQLECTKVRLASLAKENAKLIGDRQRNPSSSFSHKSNGSRIRNHSSSCAESHSKRSRYDAEDGASASRSGSKKSGRKSSASLQLQKKDDVLQTDITYFTCIGTSNAVTSPVELNDTVLVPCFRLHPISSCYQLEGTENLDDDIFMKRHQKLEIDEKRRKRWDIQRIREQRLQDKLRKGRQTRDENMRNRSPDMDTFYPMADDVQYIEVSDTLPVVAFGYPIPIISNSEFDVPWLNSSDKSWSEIGRASRGSKRGT